MFFNDPSIYLYHFIFKQKGFEFPFSNESLTEKKLSFMKEEKKG